MKDLETRRRIQTFVRTHPGSSARGIQRGLGLGWGETSYHLSHLVSAEVLRRQRGGRRDYFFPIEMSTVDRGILLAMQSAVERDILVRLARSDGLTFSEVVDCVHGGRSSVAFHLKILTASGLVQVDSSYGGKLRYRAFQAELILSLYRSFKGTFGDRWIDEFSSMWGGLARG